MSDELVLSYLVHDDPLNEIINEKNILIEELKECIAELKSKHIEECQALSIQIEQLSSQLTSTQTKQEVISSGNMGVICEYYEKVIDNILGEIGREREMYKGLSVLLNNSYTHLSNSATINDLNSNMLKQISNMKKVVTDLTKENTELKTKVTELTKQSRANEVQKIFIRKFEVELDKNNKILQSITCNYNKDIETLNIEIKHLTSALNEERERNKTLQHKNDLAKQELTIEHLSDTLSATINTEVASKVEERDNLEQLENLDNFKYINSFNVILKDKLEQIRAHLQDIIKKNENKTNAVILNRLTNNCMVTLSLVESEIRTLVRKSKYVYNAVTVGKNVIKEMIYKIKMTKSSLCSYEEMRNAAKLGIKYLRIYNNL